MKNPFYQREKRKKWFFLIALISMITLLTYDIIHYRAYSGSIVALAFDQMTEDNSPYEYYARLFVVIYVIYCFVMVVIMLTRQGTSRNLKIKIVWRHLIYQIAFLLKFIPLLLFSTPNDNKQFTLRHTISD